MATADATPPANPSDLPGSIPSRIPANTGARLNLTLTPTGAPGSVSFVGVRSTTLLTVVGMVDVRGETPHPAFPVTVTGTDAPSVLSLVVSPARCDDHAIAEDKRGTIFPLTVDVGGDRGEIAVAATPELRAELYAYVQASCAGE